MRLVYCVDEWRGDMREEKGENGWMTGQTRVNVVEKERLIETQLRDECRSWLSLLSGGQTSI